jgi:hypothetical protein
MIRLHLSPERARPVLLSLEQAAGLRTELDGIQTRVGSFEHDGMVLLCPAPSRLRTLAITSLVTPAPGR